MKILQFRTVLYIYLRIRTSLYTFIHFMTIRKFFVYITNFSCQNSKCKKLYKTVRNRTKS